MYEVYLLGDLISVPIFKVPFVNLLDYVREIPHGIISGPGSPVGRREGQGSYIYGSFVSCHLS